MPRAAIITLSRPSSAIGGEDQVGQYLFEAFRRQGWEAALFYEHESAIIAQEKFDLILSNGAQCRVNQKCPAVYWHFNERVSISNSMGLKDLGYTHVATNSTTCPEAGPLPTFYLPLAADISMVLRVFDDIVPTYKVAYVGNWNGYKGHKVDEFLSPLAKKYMPDEFAIFGGSRWSGHEELAPYWRGILPKEEWSRTSEIAESWICFRSPMQADLGMTTDRLFWLAAAGVRHIVSDKPIASELESIIDWAETAQEAIEFIEKPNRKCGLTGCGIIMTGHTYDDRVLEIIKRSSPGG